MPLQSVCPSCGQPSVGVCPQCSAKGHVLVTIPRYLDLRVCPTCRDCFLDSKWEQIEIIDAVTRTVENALNINTAKSAIYVDVREQDKNLIKTYIIVERSAGGKIFIDEFELDLRIKRETCDRCSRIAGGYYEGVVQIRADGRVPEEHELVTAADIAHRVLERERNSDRMAFLSRVERKKEGLNIYVGTTRAAKKMSRSITEVLGGSFRESPKLVGKRDGKNVYRVSFSLRLPRLTSGSIVSHNGHVFECHLVRKKVIATDLQTGEKQSLNVRDLAPAELLGSRAEARESVIVSVTDDEVQLLDPDTSATISMSRPKFITGFGDSEVLVIKTPRGVFILP